MTQSVNNTNACTWLVRSYLNFISNILYFFIAKRIHILKIWNVSTAVLYVCFI